MIVTPAAISMVRQMMRSYVGVKICRKLASDAWRTRLFVNGSTDQNAVMSIATSAAR